MGGSKSKDGSNASSKVVQKKVSTTPVSSLTASPEFETFVTVTRAHSNKLTPGKGISDKQVWEGYCNTYIRLILSSEQLQFLVEEFEDLATASRQLGNSKITKVVHLVREVLSDLNSIGQPKSTNKAMKELTAITIEAHKTATQTLGRDVDVGAVFECLLMSSVRVLRMPIADTLQASSETVSLSKAVKDLLQSPAEDFEGGNMELLFSSIARDVIDIFSGQSAAEQMDVENFSALWGQAANHLSSNATREFTAAQLPRAIQAWQQYIFTQDEDFESTPNYRGILVAFRKFVLSVIKDKHFDLNVLCPRGLQIPGTVTLVNYEINHNLGLGFVSLFPQGFSDPDASLVPIMGNLNIQVVFPDGYCKMCVFDSVKNITIPGQSKAEPPLTNLEIEKYLPQVSELVSRLVPYFDGGDLESDFEAFMIFEHNNRYHMRTKHHSIIKLGSPASFDNYRMFFFTSQQAPQSEESISVIVKNVGNQTGITADNLLMFFEPQETVSSLFVKLSLNYFGIDSQNQLGTELVDKLLETICISKNAKINGLERESVRKEWKNKISLNTTWAEIAAQAGSDGSKQAGLVDLIVFLDLAAVEMPEILAPNRVDTDLIDWDPNVMGDAVKPSLKLSYSSMFNLSMKLQGFTSEGCTEWPDNKITSILPSQLVIPFSDVRTLFELPHNFEVEQLAEAARNLCIGHQYKPKAFFCTSRIGTYFLAQVVPETKGKLRGMCQGGLIELQKENLDGRHLHAVLLERIVPDL